MTKRLHCFLIPSFPWNPINVCKATVNHPYMLKDYDKTMVSREFSLQPSQWLMHYCCNCWTTLDPMKPRSCSQHVLHIGKPRPVDRHMRVLSWSAPKVWSARRSIQHTTSLHLSIFLYVYTSIHLSIYLPIYPSIYLLVYPFIYVSLCLPVCWSIHPFNFWEVGIVVPRRCEGAAWCRLSGHLSGFNGGIWDQLQRWDRQNAAF